MIQALTQDPVERLALALDMGWQVFYQRVAYGRVKINKESSMQLHYASVLHSLGDVFCLPPEETFTIALN